MKAVLATRNQGKVREIARLTQGLGIEWLSAADIPGAPQPVESSDTLEGNARIKAEALSRATGLTAVAEDSGLFVDALGGAPGVYSARYAGPACDDAENIRKLLVDLGGRADRRAAFKAVVAVVVPGEKPVFLDGEVWGTITEKPKGEGGFGYDPVFLPEGETRVFAEMTLEEKNAISHRARAFAKVREWFEKRVSEK